jgi:hypothetical protein
MLYITNDIVSDKHDGEIDWIREHEQKKLMYTVSITTLSIISQLGSKNPIPVSTTNKSKK